MHIVPYPPYAYNYPTLPGVGGTCRRSSLLVEVKRRKTIDSGIIDDVKEKIRAIRKPRSVSIRKGVMYEGELSPAVKRCGYFDALVDIDGFLRD